MTTNEHRKQYYQENKAYLKLKALEHYYKNQEKHNACSRKYYANNTDAIREQRNRRKRSEKKEKVSCCGKPQESPLVKEVKKIVLEKLGKPFEFPEASFSVSFL